MTIRNVTQEDVDRIIDIENRSFTAPFTTEMYKAMITASPPFGGLVSLHGLDTVAGYLFYSIAADEMELLTIAVDYPHRKTGRAKALIEKMFEIAKKNNIRSVFLEVRPSNINAQHLYTSFGFVECGLRKNYYKDNGEDAIVMRKGFD